MKCPLTIVGGGLAGAAAACLLARAGGPVLLFERERTPKPKVCGEFLSCAAQSYIKALDIDLTALGALPIDRVRLAMGKRLAEAALPFKALSLPRHVLDEALLNRAAELGAEIRRGCVVREIGGNGRISLLVDGLGSVETDTLFLASGKHDLRGCERPMAAAAHDFIGLKAYFRLSLPQARMLSRHIELAMFGGGYAGLQLVGECRANLSLLVTQRRFAQADHDWHRLLRELCVENALLGARLADAAPEIDRPLAIFRLPFGFLHRALDGADNLYRLGDQMACMPSFSGDGMSIALHSAFLASEAYLNGAAADLYHCRMRQDLGPQFAWGRVLSNLIRSPAGQHLLLTAVAVMPGLLPRMAKVTRLPARTEFAPCLLSQIVQ